MAEITEETRTIAGARTRLLAGGQGAPVLFLHGGVPGVTPYCSSADLWQPVLALFAAERRVVAPDLPGSGSSERAPGEWPTIAGYTAHLRALIDVLALGPCHVVGHDEGGLVALDLAVAAPRLVRSVSVVASPAAAPGGDGVINYTLAYPPPPLWSRTSQRWALDRLSYAAQHVDDRLLDRCTALAAGPLHRQAVERMNAGAYRRLYLPSVAAAKARFYEACRTGIAVPVQILWGTHDPMTTEEHGFTLFRIIAARQTATQFHLVNRTGAFPFREAPRVFHQIVAAFCDGAASG